MAARRAEGLRQAAALVIRNSDRAVLAWVGSADFSDPAGGQVDGVLARRQPGSALKPFIYALALEDGLSLDDPILDEPLGLLVSEGVFRPLDYDRGFRGQVPLRVALASSLNLPALRLTARLNPRRVLGRLRGLGLGLPQPAEHYGLGPGPGQRRGEPLGTDRRLCRPGRGRSLSAASAPRQPNAARARGRHGPHGLWAGGPGPGRRRGPGSRIRP